VRKITSSLSLSATFCALFAKDFDAKKSSLIAKKVGDDLEVALEEGVIIFDNYFAVCATDLSCVLFFFATLILSSLKNRVIGVIIYIEYL
jgi:hypothetical protein